MLLIWSVICCIVSLIMSIETILGLRSMVSLDRVTVTRHDFPTLSIIITACNEESTITETLEKLCTQDYQNLEIICVNDRSTDNTKKLMDQFAQQHSHIRIVDIQVLPAGWLGKNYAAQQGANAAVGEWLLFMDADALLDKNTLKKVVQYAIEKKLDHIAVLPHYICKGFLYNVVNVFYRGHGLVTSLKPWLAKSKRSKKSFNLGLFCLVKSSVYRAIGGHQAIANNPVEDVAFGKLVKKAGYCPEVLNAQNSIQIEWYPTLRKMVQGLEKNCFAYFRYKIIYVIGAIVALWFLLLFPVIACFITSGIIFYLNMLSVLLMLMMYIEVTKTFQSPKIYALFYPAGLIVHTFTLCNSVLHFIKNKGIVWRGTFYSAEMLKK